MNSQNATKISAAAAITTSRDHGKLNGPIASEPVTMSGIARGDGPHNRTAPFWMMTDIASVAIIPDISSERNGWISVRSISMPRMPTVTAAIRRQTTNGISHWT